MNLQQLRYVLEVEKNNSITRAAKNLFMGQPNLSKIIKELELEIGITIFKRTPKGVEPTRDGKQFLQYAQTILSQMNELESLYKINNCKNFQFNISVPRATYISIAFSTFLNSFMLEEQLKDKKLNIHYKETNPLTVIQDVVTGESDLGVVRYQNIYENYFLELIREHNLQYETIGEYAMRVLLHETHPLASMQSIPFHLLGDYTEIVHGDFEEPGLSFASIKKTAHIDTPQKQLCVYDRSSQFDILENVAGTYLWVSPIPETELQKHHLVTKKCNIVTNTKDIILYPTKSALKDYELDFIVVLKNTLKSLS